MSGALSYAERLAGRRLGTDEEEDPRALEEAERVAGRKLKKREKREPRKTPARDRRRFREEDQKGRAETSPPRGAGLVGKRAEPRDKPTPALEDIRLDIE